MVVLDRRALTCDSYGNIDGIIPSLDQRLLTSISHILVMVVLMGLSLAWTSIY